jgi:hypothetical protein
MGDWATEVRELGNDAAHPDPKATPTEAQDARDIVRVLEFLLFYIYDLPKTISDYRSRKKPSP